MAAENVHALEGLVQPRVERRRREGRTPLAGVAGELAGAPHLRLRQAFSRMFCHKTRNTDHM